MTDELREELQIFGEYIILLISPLYMRIIIAFALGFAIGTIFETLWLVVLLDMIAAIIMVMIGKYLSEKEQS